MHTINPLKAGTAVGLAMGVFHLAWASVVGFGLAQALIDFVLRVHFVQPFIQILPFNVGTAALLVALTSGVGFVTGALVAVIWNQLRPSDARVANSPAARAGV